MLTGREIHHQITHFVEIKIANQGAANCLIFVGRTKRVKNRRQSVIVHFLIFYLCDAFEHRCVIFVIKSVIPSQTQ